ncbi:TPA: hypothetical protein ACH3X3_002065 [Trebouxia sp. C0006]
MRPLTVQFPVTSDCVCHTGWQQKRARKLLNIKHNAHCTRSLRQRVSMAAKWRELRQSPQVTAKALEQTEETSWRAKDDTAFVAQHQAITQSRWKSFFTTRYDREIFAVLFPALLAIFLDPVMILVDTAIVGRLGTLPLAAVGLSNLLFFFCTVFFSFLLVVTTPRVASAVANQDLEEASLTTAHTLMVGAVCGVLLGTALWHGAPSLVAVLRPDAAVYALAVPHLQMKALACPAAVLMFVAVGAFRGFKDTTTPLIASAAANAVNLSLDLFFVFVAGWGVIGAASAATIGQYVGLATMLFMLWRKGVLRLSDLKTLPSPRELLPMAQAGFGLAFCIAAIMCSVVGATTIATGLGAVTLAAHTVVKNIVDYANNIFGTFSTVAQSLVASELGKGNAVDAQGVLIRLLQIGFATGSLVSLALLLLQGRLIALFTSDAQVIAQATAILPLIAFVMPFAPFATSLEGTLLGALEIPHVAIRTILSATVSCSFLYWANMQHIGLLGVWSGLVLVIFLNMLCDIWKMTSSSSPFVKVIDEPSTYKPDKSQ